MTNKKQNNDAMPSKGVRLRVDQWEDCDKYYQTLGLASRNDFIRDAVDFYLEYLFQEPHGLRLEPYFFQPIQIALV